jgi:putative endonuclease
MAGLVPAIHAFALAHVKGGWVYIITNRRNGTLYTGVTANLSRRVWEHREGLYEGFTEQYSLKRLVYYALRGHSRCHPAREQHETWPAPGKSV